MTAEDFYPSLVHRLCFVTRLKSFIESTRSECHFDEGNIALPESWPPNGLIEIKNVHSKESTTRSRTQAVSCANLALKGINVIIQASRHLRAEQQVDHSILRQRVIALLRTVVSPPKGAIFKENLDPLAMSSEAQCCETLCIVGLWPLVEQRGGLDARVEAESPGQGQKQLVQSFPCHPAEKDTSQGTRQHRR
ncbi:hypothetical protein F5Y17DRAFT_229817 [Xylariaceae sp. FL0594]|nr:hypothetical protein F5Y17DRAFT_229817 [Xylariaceae sp. FL0594]